VARTLPKDPSVNITSIEATADIDLTPDTLSNLKWIFVHAGQFLTCEIGTRGHWSYDVCVIPHWDVGSSVIEPYDQPAAALHRHAQFASRLRDAGWVRISENRTGHMASA
jgi:hypothetical protein